MFVVKNAGSDGCSMDEFDISGSTYEPVGDVTLNGTSIKCSNYPSLVELANICAMCNDSSLDYNEVTFFTKELLCLQRFRKFY